MSLSTPRPYAQMLPLPSERPQKRCGLDAGRRRGVHFARRGAESRYHYLANTNTYTVHERVAFAHSAVVCRDSEEFFISFKRAFPHFTHIPVFIVIILFSSREPRAALPGASRLDARAPSLPLAASASYAFSSLSVATMRMSRLTTGTLLLAPPLAPRYSSRGAPSSLLVQWEGSEEKNHRACAAGARRWGARPVLHASFVLRASL
ncbi:hypothetical protein C8J57DRAFT_1508456 [Mycena rebaudengoi]|nr:hypothetical protein C8J57DRAFT_1508456 [Mycena rebaudengoi]